MDTPFSLTVAKRAKFVKMMMVQNGADMTGLEPNEIESLDVVITAIITFLAMYEMVEKVQVALVEEAV